MEIAYQATGGRAAALELAAAELDPQEIYHLDTSTTFQMHLGTFRPWITPETAERVMRENPRILLAVEDRSAYPELFAEEGISREEVFRWSPDADAEPLVRVYALSKESAPCANGSGN